MNKIWIGTNWKMTKTMKEGVKYTKQLVQISRSLRSDIALFIIPSYPSLDAIKRTADGSGILIGAQNMHWEDAGPFTGEVSPVMLNEIGIDMVELGHSERRQFFNETDVSVNKKVLAALNHGMRPLICIGENLEQKKSSISKETIAAQLKVSLKSVSEAQTEQIFIAYEPVWAIGEGGIPASPGYVDDIHCFLRQTLMEMYGETGLKIPLLYGGSVNHENFLNYIQSRDVNGLFIGRAAWEIDHFHNMLGELENYISE